MTKAMGIRVEPKKVHYAVVEGAAEEANLISAQSVAAPVTHNEPAQLTWYRERVQALMREHMVDAVGVRYPESNSRGSGSASAMRRLRIEGVLLEAANALSIAVPVAGPLRHIESRLGASKPLKAYMTSDEEIRGISLAGKNANVREAILVAVAALEGGSG